MSRSESDLLLLDTHVWIWLMSESARLASSKSLQVIQRASKLGSLRIAAISAWEVGMLEAKNRISFPIPCLDWVNQALNAPGVSLVPLLPEIAIESSRLPGTFHGDPADRILVASARKLGAHLVTDDSKIKKYGKDGHLQVIPV